MLTWVSDSDVNDLLRSLIDLEANESDRSSSDGDGLTPSHPLSNRDAMAINRQRTGRKRPLHSKKDVTTMSLLSSEESSSSQSDSRARHSSKRSRTAFINRLESKYSNKSKKSNSSLIRDRDFFVDDNSNQMMIEHAERYIREQGYDTMELRDIPDLIRSRLLKDLEAAYKIFEDQFLTIQKKR